MSETFRKVFAGNLQVQEAKRVTYASGSVDSFTCKDSLHLRNITQVLKLLKSETAAEPKGQMNCC